jgi:hypothetical protein
MRSIRATELSKAEGLMRIERSNKDLHMQRLELEKAEERKTFIEVAQTVVSAVSSRMGAFLSDPEAVAKTVGAAVVQCCVCGWGLGCVCGSDSSAGDWRRHCRDDVCRISRRQDWDGCCWPTCRCAPWQTDAGKGNIAAKRHFAARDMAAN